MGAMCIMSWYPEFNGSHFVWTWRTRTGSTTLITQFLECRRCLAAMMSCRCSRITWDRLALFGSLLDPFDNLWPKRTFVEFKGHSPMSKFEQETVKQTTENGLKLRWRQHGRCGVIVPGIKHSRLCNVHDRTYYVHYGGLPERSGTGRSWNFESVAWLCVITEWHQLPHNTATCASFHPSLWLSSSSNFWVEPSPSSFIERNLSDQRLWFWSAVAL